MLKLLSRMLKDLERLYLLFISTLRWGGGKRAAECREIASERAKRVSEPTIGMLIVMSITGGGGAGERANTFFHPERRPRFFRRYLRDIVN